MEAVKPLSEVIDLVVAAERELLILVPKGEQTTRHVAKLPIICTSADLVWKWADKVLHNLHFLLGVANGKLAIRDHRGRYLPRYATRKKLVLALKAVGYSVGKASSLQDFKMLTPKELKEAIVLLTHAAEISRYQVWEQINLELDKAIYDATLKDYTRATLRVNALAELYPWCKRVARAQKNIKAGLNAAVEREARVANLFLKVAKGTKSETLKRQMWQAARRHANLAKQMDPANKAASAVHHDVHHANVA